MRWELKPPKDAIVEVREDLCRMEYVCRVRGYSFEVRVSRLDVERLDWPADIVDLIGWAFRVFPVLVDVCDRYADE